MASRWGPTQGHSPTRLEALVPSRDSRARTRSPSPRAWRPDFPGAAREKKKKMSASASPQLALLADSLPLSLNTYRILTTVHTHSPPPCRGHHSTSAWGFLPSGKDPLRDTFPCPAMFRRRIFHGLLQHCGHPSAQKRSPVAGLAPPANFSRNLDAGPCSLGRASVAVLVHLFVGDQAGGGVGLRASCGEHRFSVFKELIVQVKCGCGIS